MVGFRVVRYGMVQCGEVRAWELICRGRELNQNGSLCRSCLHRFRLFVDLPDEYLALLFAAILGSEPCEDGHCVH